MPEDKRTWDIESRKKIYELISNAPGLHMREIHKRLNIPLGTVEYHLMYLEDNDLVIAKEEGRYKRYYPKGVMGSDVRRILSLLRQDIPRRIVIYLLEHPNATFGDISEQFDIAASTLSFHITKLIKKDIVERVKMGRTSLFRVKYPDMVVKVLIAHKRSFLDELVERFVSTWTEYHA